ncbi:MAG TPA: hypothetical protein VGR69_08580 [Candidatus Rubrimentiphilum sp.]|nr:hypothetical protein [Candidatus Rubrimentiphilum sp.]
MFAHFHITFARREYYRDLNEFVEHRIGKNYKANGSFAAARPIIYADADAEAE